ncbi:lanthionine synthetase C family protein [Sphaerimonospora cavernae]|uniref:Lanthionine synthetase C family protein n=1 Tax=Sphaerimonospora cavernae TaxID=1740611 RepID=A0ABV6TZM5_9ACTN
MTPRTAEGITAADRIAARLAEAQSVPDAANQRWQAQSLSRGPGGVALLHIERAHTGSSSWETAHTLVKAATSTQISAADDVGLYIGAPAISFVLHAAGADGVSRYRTAQTRLDEHVIRLVHRRVDAALARINRGEPAEFAEYDLFYGLTGIGALLLRFLPGSDALGRILSYLVRLTVPPRGDESREVPGWWVTHDPDPILPTPGGHANLGLAHGISGPLALLALATRRGIVVDRHLEAIERICDHLDRWRQESDSGPWWPQWIGREELRIGVPRQPGPGRPSWCYGTPGLVRAQQLAAIATRDTTRQLLAEKALVACLNDPCQLERLTDIGLCHGWAGLYQTASRAAADALRPDIGEKLPYLAERLVRCADNTERDPDGFLDGAVGLALALHGATRTAPPISGWDSCLLIA